MLIADRSEAASLTDVARHAGTLCALLLEMVVGLLLLLLLSVVLVQAHVMLTFCKATWVDDHSWMNIHEGKEICTGHQKMAIMW